MLSHAFCQVQELHRKLSEESRRADNLAFEMKKLEEKHETVLKEKEVRQLLNHGKNRQEDVLVTLFTNICTVVFLTTRGSSSREIL